MKIEKYVKRPIHDEPNGKFTFGISLNSNKQGIQQTITFDNETERDIVFNHWSKAIAELNKSKAVFRPVYESENGEIRILSLRYTTPEEAMEVEITRRQHFGEGMKLVAIYNEAERSFQ